MVKMMKKMMRKKINLMDKMIIIADYDV